MNFRASFCDPLNPNIIELGDMNETSIVDEFKSIKWADYLLKMTTVKETEIFFSPSFEVENKSTKHGLAFAVVGDTNNYEFYIFYKRPKKVNSFFGLKQKIDNYYTSDKSGFTEQAALDCLHALLRNDLDYLANKIGQ